MPLPLFESVEVSKDIEKEKNNVRGFAELFTQRCSVRLCLASEGATLDNYRYSSDDLSCLKATANERDRDQAAMRVEIKNAEFCTDSKDELTDIVSML